MKFSTEFNQLNTYIQALLDVGFIEDVKLLHTIFMGEYIPEHTLPTNDIASKLLEHVNETFDFEHIRSEEEEGSDDGYGVIRIGNTYYKSTWGKDWEGWYIEYQQVWDNVIVVKPYTFTQYL